MLAGVLLFSWSLVSDWARVSEQVRAQNIQTLQILLPTFINLDANLKPLAGTLQLPTSRAAAWRSGLLRRSATSANPYQARARLADAKIYRAFGL